MGPIVAMLDEQRSLPPRARLDGVRLLYITPLRAVARDIEKAIAGAMTELGVRGAVESRTGDTPASVRGRQKDRLPAVLITTPESLSLLLTRDNARALFSGLRGVVIDEWHELLSSKRGTQTELAMARLRKFAPGLRTWALSATLDNLDEAARAAVGVGDNAPEPIVIRGDTPRQVEILSLIPQRAAMPWAGHMGMRLLPEVLERLDPEVSTLVFLNTRAQAELWYQAILHERPQWEPVMGLHHGSIDRAARAKLEEGLKSGRVRLVVATSSLDLGVDFAPVERVVQIGSPKGVARLIQRAGRASHRPGASCAILCVPTHAMELIEIAAVRDAALRGRIEPRTPMRKPLDVLVQHIVSSALGEGFRAAALLEEVRTTAAYADLSDEEFGWCLELVRSGGATLSAYPEYHRIVPADDSPDPLYRVASPRLAQLHRLNVGTIAGEATLEVRLLSGKRLGSIEDYFVSHLRPGERFLYAGRVLTFVGIRDTAAIVRPATGKTAYTPHWAGTRLPISESLSAGVRAAVRACADGSSDSPEFDAVRPIIDAQARLSAVPDEGQLLVEVTRTRDGVHLFAFPFEGRLVNGGLAALVALRLSRLAPSTYSTAANDYGFELLTADDLPFESMLGPAIFSPDRLAEDALESANISELARLQFREIARVSGLVFQMYPGAKKRTRQVHSTAGLIYDVFREFDPGNLLLEQARREVLQKHFEATRLARAMDRLAHAEVLVRRTDRPTPLSMPLIIERLGGRITSESLEERVRKMTQSWEPGPQDQPCSSKRRRRRSA